MVLGHPIGIKTLEVSPEPGGNAEEGRRRGTIFVRNEIVKLGGITGLDSTPRVRLLSNDAVYSAINVHYYSDYSAIEFTPEENMITGSYDVELTNADGTSIIIPNGLVVLPGATLGSCTEGQYEGQVEFTEQLTIAPPQGNVYLVKAGSVTEAIDRVKGYPRPIESNKVWNATNGTAGDGQQSWIVSTSLRGTDGNVYAVWVDNDYEVDDARFLFKVNDLSISLP